MAPRIVPGNLTFSTLASSPTALCGRASTDGAWWCWGRVGRVQSTRDGVPVRLSRRQVFTSLYLGTNLWCGRQQSISAPDGWFCQ